eukprot:11193381-Lingulodinium_polyedra.AAC.1
MPRDGHRGGRRTWAPAARPPAQQHGEPRRLRRAWRQASQAAKRRHDGVELLMPAFPEAVAGILGRPIFRWAGHVPPVHESCADVEDFPGLVV